MKTQQHLRIVLQQLSSFCNNCHLLLSQLRVSISVQRKAAPISARLYGDMLRATGKETYSNKT